MSGDPTTPRPADVVVFISPLPGPEPGHVGNDLRASGELERPLKDVRHDWRLMVDQICEIVSGTDEAIEKSGVGLDSITFGLAFNGRGHLAFIADAGVTASVQIRLTRGGSRDRDPDSTEPPAV